MYCSLVVVCRSWNAPMTSYSSMRRRPAAETTDGLTMDNTDDNLSVEDLTSMSLIWL